MSTRATQNSHIVASVCDQVINPYKLLQILHLELDICDNPIEIEGILIDTDPHLPLPQLKNILCEVINRMVNHRHSLIHFATILFRYDDPKAGKKLEDFGKCLN